MAMFNSHVKLPEGTTILNCGKWIYVPWSKDGFGDVVGYFQWDIMGYITNIHQQYTISGCV